MEEHSAPSTGARKTSQEKSCSCRLKCDPEKLPEPPHKVPVVKRLCDLSKDAAIEVKDFYREQKMSRVIRWMKRNKKRRTHY